MIVIAILSGIDLLSQTNFEASKQIPIMSLDNLVQGRLYVPDYSSIQGSQYLIENWTPGDIGLLENEYRDLPLRYDLIADALVLMHRSDKGINKIHLNKEHIQYFTLGTRIFINLDYSRYRESGLNKGYYEVVFEDTFSFLVKRGFDLEIRDAIKYLVKKDSWFLLKEEEVYRIRNKKSLLAAFEDKLHKPISTFMKKELIRLKNAEEEDWLRLAKYLNTLLQSN